LAGCGTNQVLKPVRTATSNPSDIQEAYLASSTLYGSDDGGPSANIAVLLPTSGDAKSIGNDIKTSVETAFLHKTKQNLKVTFYDLSGEESEREEVIKTALYTNPDIVIGPLFAEDAKTIRGLKPSELPVISFTSDINALGNGVMTMNLIPSQSIEAITNQMKSDGATNMIIFAPNDNSGRLMTSVADKAASLYDIPVIGVFYYESGNSDSIKNAALRASMYDTRKAANTRAREILSDILTKESLDWGTRKNLTGQLEKISRNDTLGQVPYDSVLFLGNGEDTKTISSFLRYYGIGNRDAAFYGTTLWHGSDIASDFTLSGAKYATLPEISDNFINLYNMVSGKNPDYLSAFGYDAANLALGIIYTQQEKSDYILNPNGYIGTTGIFRIQENGESERALRIMELNGSESAVQIKDAPSNFITSIYNVNIHNLSSISERELKTRGINPGDYITIPENLRKKSEYRTKTIGANYKVADEDEESTFDTPVQIYESSEPETVSDPEYKSVKIEPVSRKYIDSVEITE
jgi:outer membrane PBP1 activator LpoA protein